MPRPEFTLGRGPELAAQPLSLFLPLSPIDNRILQHAVCHSPIEPGLIRQIITDPFVSAFFPLFCNATVLILICRVEGSFFELGLYSARAAYCRIFRAPSGPAVYMRSRARARVFSFMRAPGRFAEERMKTGFCWRGALCPRLFGAGQSVLRASARPRAAWMERAASWLERRLVIVGAR